MSLDFPGTATTTTATTSSHSDAASSDSPSYSPLPFDESQEQQGQSSIGQSQQLELVVPRSGSSCSLQFDKVFNIVKDLVLENPSLLQVILADKQITELKNRQEQNETVTLFGKFKIIILKKYIFFKWLLFFFLQITIPKCHFKTNYHLFWLKQCVNMLMDQQLLTID